jgi:Tol biopolymer transport system component
MIAFSADTSLLPGESKAGCVYSIPVGGGQVRRLTDTLCSQPAFSPDGEMLAYVQQCASRTENEDWHSDIWVVPVAGGTPTQISHLEGAVLGPVWSPDSRMIVFDRFGGGGRASNELFIVPLTDDYEPAGPPSVLELPLTSSNLVAGWSSSNQIGITLETAARSTIYAVPATGGIATQVAPTGVGGAMWFPDGERLLFTDDTACYSTLAEEGRTAIIPIAGVKWAMGADPSPDGERLSLAGGGEGRPIGLFTVSTDGGEAELVQPAAPGYRGYDKTSWSPDGKWLAFTRYDQSGEADLCVIPSDGGEIRQLVASAPPWRTIFIGRPAWSPDGKQIAYPTPAEDGTGTICIIPLEGGDPEIVARFEPGVVVKCVSWSRDGKRLAYAAVEASYNLDVGMGRGVSGEIWSLQLDTKEVQRIRTGLDLKDVDDIDWSPDGDKLLFSAYWASEQDFYLISDFLPLLRPAEPEPRGEPEQKEMLIRMILSAPEVGYAAPSPDGRFLSYVDWNTGNLAIREMVSGEVRYLTNDGNLAPPVQCGLWSRVSPDGRRVAYSWHEPNGTTLRIARFDGSDHRVLYSAKDSHAYFREWSSDGSQIVAIIVSDDDVNQLAWISVADGSVRIVKSLGKGWPQAVCRSPDDRYLAYDLPIAGNSGNFDIFLLATDGSHEVPLAEHPANDKLLGWAPGRAEVLFISDRSGTWDAWVVSVVGGKPQGAPRTVKRNVGEVAPMAFTQDGSYYYSVFTRHWTTATAPFDAATGAIQTSHSRPILGSNRAPQWSPDGTRLAYVTEHFTKAGPGYIDYRAVNIRDMETDEVRELARGYYTSYPRWSPDGRFLLATGYERSDPHGEEDWRLYRIDVVTDQVTPIADWDHKCVRGPGHCLFKGDWSRDGASIFYVNHGSICRHDIKTGQEEQLYTNPDLLRKLDSSHPDGQTLIFHLGDPVDQQQAGSRNDTRHLMMMHLPDGEVRELLGFEESRGIQTVGWTPGGTHLLFQRSEQEGISLWKISSEGGHPERLWQTDGELWGLSLHPSRPQVAFHTLEEESEIWVMENFLPED